MKIFLASIESNREHSIAAMEANAKHVLTSFYYAGYHKRSYRQEWLQCLRLAGQRGGLRLIDSGAFTLRTSVLALVSTGGAAGGKDVDYDEFLAEYITWTQWLVKNNLADLWVELDIAAIMPEGYNWVHRQRDKILASGLGAGLVNVWHSDQDWAYWLYLLREAKLPGRSNYVAIEGNQLNRDPLDYNKFLREAYDRGVRVHGFRMTSEQAIKRWPFYSVDSSSWVTTTSRGSYVSTSRTGGVVNTRRKGTGDNALRSSWAGDIPRMGTTSKFRANVLKQSAAAWVEAERQITEIWKTRGIDWEAAIGSPRVST